MTMADTAIRNRANTEAKIIKAATELLANEGFQALGINKIAAAAGVDKKLIYSYFGGMEGVIEHIANDLKLWFGSEPKPKEFINYAEMTSELLGQYLKTLREEKMLRHILLWELSDNSDSLKTLEQSRSIMFGKWFMQMKGELESPSEVDAPAINAILLAAMHYLTIRADTLGRFAGLDLKTEADWQRVQNAASSIIHEIYKDKK
jgi:AcrR family transcriptional regulator